jgi:hypothetical protein
MYSAKAGITGGSADVRRRSAGVKPIFSSGSATAPPAVGSDVTAHPTATTTNPANQRSLRQASWLAGGGDDRIARL